MAKYIIGLVGLLGSGKGTAAKILEERYGAKVFRFSTILRDILDRLNIEKTRDNLMTLSEVLRHGFGDDVLAYALENDAVSANEDLVVIDGIRRLGDLAALEPLPNFTLIAIDVPTDIRFERIKNRGENVGEKHLSREDFEKQEKLPTEITIPEVMARASVNIDNRGSLDDLMIKINILMDNLQNLQS
ncbi:MAG: AAA family ATPase [Patescibacteria group bacterium]